jgi:predicted MFS family arabinose efflux permease
VFILTSQFRTYQDPDYSHIAAFAAIKKFIRNRDLGGVFMAHLVLQTFFTAMIIYSPIYLTQYIGLSWTEFGTITAIAIMAYFFFEYPVGIIADRYTGEKEIMALGFTVIAVSTAAISFITTTSLLVWVIVMFLTRVGCALAEVTTESYFFKHTKASDAQAISFFRLTRPLAGLLGALLGTVGLLFVPFNLLFVIVASTMVIALFGTLLITDTK